MASTRIYRTSGTPTNDKIFTVSGWFKFNSNAGHVIFGSDGSNNTSWTQLRFGGSDGALELSSYSTNWVRTTRLFRDFSAWYHIVVTCDSTQSTAADRIKWWVNGEQITSFSVDNRSSTTLNQSWGWNKNTTVNNIGGENASGYGDFAVAHFHNIDGTAYQASDFGETDSTTGIWKPKVSPSVTYGNNGYFLKFADSSSMGTDSSGNSNTNTIGGNLTQTQDTPSNIFCRLNPNILTPNGTFANLNTKFTDGDSSHKTTWGTLGFTSGKWYWECKASSSGTNKFTVGLDDIRNQSNYKMVSSTNLIVGYSPSGGYANGDAIGWYYSTLYKNGSSVASSLDTIVSDNIMQVAVDADNGKIYFGKNGTWRVANSSTFDSSQHDTTFTTGQTYCPAFSAESCSWLCNFGDGYFGTTAVSSSNADGAGLGLFEYAPPSGYYALCTKNLNTYG